MAKTKTTDPNEGTLAQRRARSAVRELHDCGRGEPIGAIAGTLGMESGRVSEVIDGALPKDEEVDQIAAALRIGSEFFSAESLGDRRSFREVTA